MDQHLAESLGALISNSIVRESDLLDCIVTFQSLRDEYGSFAAKVVPSEVELRDTP